MRSMTFGRSSFSPLPGPIKGAAILTEAQIKALIDSEMYINVLTAKFPEGEIRGQVKPAKRPRRSPAKITTLFGLRVDRFRETATRIDN